MQFSDLGLAPALAQAAADLGFANPTPVQAASIPPVLAGRDLLAAARTGSGKTAAYALPLLQRWLDHSGNGPRRVRALVLVPTRELAAQVGEVLRLLAEKLAPRPKLIVAFGGVSINPQMLALRGGADVVVATPGTPARPGRTQRVEARHAWSCSCWTKPTACWTSALPKNSPACLSCCPAHTSEPVLFRPRSLTAVQDTGQHELLHEPQRMDVPSPRSRKRRPWSLQRAIRWWTTSARRTQLLRQLIKDARLAACAGLRGHAVRWPSALASKLHHGATSSPPRSMAA
jgi:ATP-dependent RNA helicase RhlE